MFETVNPIWKGNLGGNVFTKPLTKRASLDVWKCAFQGEVRYVKISVVDSFKKNIAKGTTDPGVDCFDQ